MGIGKRLKEAREYAGLTQEELGKLVGVTGSAITNYEKENSHPKEEIMYALINALKVDPNFLFQDCVKIKKAPSLSDEALKIAKYYDKLDRWGKQVVNSVIRDETARCENAKKRMIAAKEEEEDSHVIEMPSYLQSASAGYGNWLEEAEEITITVPDTPMTRRADFAIRVSGDSMEPKYSDGDLVFVKKQDDVEVGEYGIWIVDGCAYLKKRGIDKLISLNRQYPDVEQGEDVHCVGKVIGKL